MTDIEQYIKRFQSFEFGGEFRSADKSDLKEFQVLINKSHFRRRIFYLEQIEKIYNEFDELPFLFDRSDVLKFRKTQQSLVNLTYQVIEENKKVFIVHGKDINMRDKMEAFLGKLHIENVILENETNEGKTIIEKFLEKTSDCNFAIVLLSPDDIGGLSTDITSQSFRARQNVILELGFFLGRLGRHKLIVLHPDEIEIEKPSDFEGIVYRPFDNKGAWKHKLIKELKAAKFYIDEADVNRI
jgi:predicted nucleotide-binding protein